MASLKEVKTRINSVKNTRKITSAMKMVASAKLHKMQGTIAQMLPYQTKLSKILRNLLSTDITIDSPYVIKRAVKRVAVVVFSSNSSLCGAYNTNIIREFSETLAQYDHLGQENVLIYPIGRKIEEAVKRLGLEVQETHQTLSDKPTYAEAASLAEKLLMLYAQREIDHVEVIYYHFKSRGAQVLTHHTLLPLDIESLSQWADSVESKSAFAQDYIIEPSVQELITELIPMVLKQQLFTFTVDTSASEHAARTLAMQIATDNANDLIQELTKQYNKSRQQAITNELLDIVGGSMR